MSNAALSLQVVTAYYLDPTNGPTPLLDENSLMAADVAPSWTAFREALTGLGWEPYISPPNDPNDPRAVDGYTKGFFRTPSDQAMMVQEDGDGASPVDDSAHQAGRAFDLDLNGMQAAFSDYDYGTVVSTAAQYGFYPTAAGEAWHFDDNPAANPAYGSITAAVAAIGNTQAEVNADIAAGTPTPQEAALSSSGMNLLLIGGLLAVAIFLMMDKQKSKKPEHKESGATSRPEYA